jgi:hypothetical protein
VGLGGCTYGQLCLLVLSCGAARCPRAKTGARNENLRRPTEIERRKNPAAGVIWMSGSDRARVDITGTLSEATNG